MERFEVLCKAKVTIRDKLYKFTFDRVDGKELDFEPGQYIIVDVGNSLRRAYSLASQPGSNRLEFFISTDVGGPGSTYFEKLQVGDLAKVVGPMGKFVFKSEGPAIFISTGTGVAPFRSIVNQLLESGYDKDLAILHGVRYEEDVFLQSEFKELEKKHSNFRYTLTLSKPTDKWPGGKGRVTAHLDKINDIQKYDFYLCGAKKMVISVKEDLTAKGVKKEQIFFELY